MNTELQSLRIDKSHRAKRDEKRVWPWVLLLILLAGGGAGVWQWHNTAAGAEVETMQVRMPEGAAAANDLVALQATGYIIAAHKIELASKVVGRVAWIGVEMGDKIKKDQILVRLEDDEYQARVAQQKGQLDNAKARLAELVAGSRPEEIAQALALWDRAKVEYENADLAYQRLVQVKGTRSVTQTEIDDAEALMKARKAQAESVHQQYELTKAGARKEQIAAQAATVSQLEGSLAMSMIDLNNTVIRAPLASTVLERNVEVGEFVTNGFVGDRGAKGYVVSLADLNDLLVELDISQNNFSKVFSDQPCWIVTDAYPDKKYNGVVERISPLANRQKATVLVRVKVLSPDELLKPDMNATVSFLSPQKAAGTQGSAAAGAEKPAIRVKATAIREGAVFVVENGKAIRRPVTVGLTASNGDVEIKKGLSVGEDLIVSPPATLHDGDVVKMQAGKP